MKTQLFLYVSISLFLFACKDSQAQKKTIATETTEKPEATQKPPIDKMTVSGEEVNKFLALIESKKPNKQNKNITTDEEGRTVIKVAAEEVEVNIEEQLEHTIGSNRANDIPKEYQFSYVVSYNVDKKGKMKRKELLFEPGQNYFGIVLNDEKIAHTMVMDPDRDLAYLFVGEHTKTAIPLAKDNVLYAANYLSIPGVNSNNQSYTAEKMGYKTMQGVSSKGFKINTPDGELKVYIGVGTPVHYKGGIPETRYIPRDKYHQFNTSMIMELQFTPNNKDESGVYMVCTGIREKKQTIATQDYQPIVSTTK